MSKKKDDGKFGQIEYNLYHYEELQIKIDNLLLDIEDLEDSHISLRAANFDEKISSNGFSSTVENDVVKREKDHVERQCMIELLKSKRKYNSNLKSKIDKALTQLNETEMKLVKLRYFSKERKTWIEISLQLGFDKDHCIKMRNKVIDKLSNLIYP